MTIVVDTLTFANKLEASGFTSEQAKGAASAFCELTRDHTLDLVTNLHLDTKLAEIRSELRELELRMTIKLGGMLVVLCGILLTAMKLFAG